MDIYWLFDSETDWDRLVLGMKKLVNLESHSYRLLYTCFNANPTLKDFLNTPWNLYLNITRFIFVFYHNFTGYYTYTIWCSKYLFMLLLNVLFEDILVKY